MRVFKRGKNWYADYTVGNRRKRNSFGLHKKMAELFLKDLELSKIRGELKVVDEKISISEFFQLYKDYCKSNKSAYTAIIDGRRINTWEGYFVEQWIAKLTDITPLVVEKFKAKILAKGDSPVTFNRYLELLRAALNKALEWGLLRENRLKDFRNLKSDRCRRVPDNGGN